MNKKKFLSLIMALVMLVGVFSPLTALAAEGDVTAPVGTDLKTSKTKPEETTVNVYKLEAESYNSPRKWDHNGGKLSQDQLNTLGKNVKPLKGVEFSYYTVTAAQLEKLKAAKPAPATAEKVKEVLGEDFNQTPTKLTKTDKDGMATVKLKNGNYWFIETETPANVTTNGSHAVPFALTLPQVKLEKNDEGNFVASADGEYLTELNIYPKNTTTTPEIDKDFEGQANPTKPRTEEDKNKNKRDYTLGDDVPYEIKTVIPANTEYKSVYWSDQMTEGLTFKKDTLKVQFDGVDADAADFTLTEEENGFKLVLNTSGLEKIKNKDKDVTITVTYKAELNEKSVVNIPESNDVTFHYGNKPTEGNTPVPNKPNDDKKITVTKTMTGVEWPKDGIKVQLYNANTGAKVGDVQTLTSDNPSYTWENLDLRYEYKVVELTTGYDVIYGKGETAGTLSIENKETEEPEPLKPHEPKVVQYGKKFVKADKGTNKSLAGAKFVVKNVSFSNNDDNHLESAKDKYLALKDVQQTNADRVKYLNARAIYEDMLKEGSGKTQQEADAFYKSDVEPAYKELKTKYVWKEATVTAATGDADFENNDNLVVLESDKAGRFAIDGLPAGTYELVEVKAPAGYALPTNNFEFTVDENSFNNEKDGVVYEQEDKEVTVTDGGTAKRINNSNLTIPQTGGMGTVLFTIVGISLMAGAVVAMKRNREEA